MAHKVITTNVITRQMVRDKIFFLGTCDLPTLAANLGLKYGKDELLYIKSCITHLIELGEVTKERGLYSCTEAVQLN